MAYTVDSVGILGRKSITSWGCLEGLSGGVEGWAKLG